ncbi:MAG: hypothetical protein ACE5E3_04440 [Mariprofundus sp.]
MSQKQSTFSTAEQWRASAMQRESGISADESDRRAELADAHNRQERISDPDTLSDQQLYIQGKMDLDEYQDYLLFKHTRAAS